MEKYMLVSKMQSSSLSLEKQAGPASGNGDLDSGQGSSMEESDFCWGDYLEETGTRAVPHAFFRHVEISIRSSFQAGMKLEVANKSNPDTYWVATIITTCGQLLLLRFCGFGEDRRADFWCDVTIADVHPVGWCTQNNKVLMPPDAIKEKYADWREFLISDLTGSRTAPASLLDGPLRGKGPIDLITVGSLIELQDSQNPFQYWIVSVIENIGGRLRLRYVGLEDTESYDRWLFYLDYRLRPVGWCQENNYRMDPPSELYHLKMISEWKYALENSLIVASNSPLPVEVFKDHVDLRSHFFTVGMKLEMVNMSDPFHICPASVTKVFSKHFFQVTIDDLSPEPDKPSMVCHADSLGLLPVQWCLKNGVNLTLPRGYSDQSYNWVDYYKQHTTAEEAPSFCFRNTTFARGFTKNMKLEAVNPRNPSELCVASVVNVKGRLLWLHLEGLEPPIPEVIVDMDSMDIFPVGWCDANSYPLTTPYKKVSGNNTEIAVVQLEEPLLSTVPVENIPQDLSLLPHTDTAGTANGKYSCPQLFVNHRCFSGPFLNKGRIAELPQSVGPGSCVLVLKEVLSMLVNAAYKPGRVLRELQQVEDPQWETEEEVLKAKYRGKPYGALVKIVRTADQVSDFCQRVCVRLQCCPNLFSPVLISENCPENCSVRTKTKYTYYYGKRKRIVKPPVGESNAAESEPPKPTRRKKRRKSVFVQKRRKSSTVDLTAGLGEENEEEAARALGEGTTASEETSSEIRGNQTDTLSAEVPAIRPRRAMTLRSSSEAVKRALMERAQRIRPVRTTASAKERNKAPPARAEEPEQTKQEEAERLIRESNPLEWTVTDVVRFIKLTDCAPLAKIFQEQDIDGQALLLLTLPTVQECMELKLGPAIKLCHQIERVKLAFYAQYAN